MEVHTSSIRSSFFSLLTANGEPVNYITANSNFFGSLVDFASKKLVNSIRLWEHCRDAMVKMSEAVSLTRLP